MNTPMRWLAPAVLLTLFVACTERAPVAQEVPTAPPPGATAKAAPQADYSGTLPDFSALVDAYGPAVVNVTTVTGGREVRSDAPEISPDDPFYEFFRGFGFGIPRGGRTPPMRGEGSGFVVSADGYILTNAHVVADANEVTVRMTDRREYRAKVVGIDRRTDVAVLKIDAKNLPVVKVGRADELRPGQWVIAIGSPFGFENSVTAGIVSATARSLGSPDNYTPFIQTDVAVNPGNSGGPLFNLKGEVVGINSQIYSRTGGYQGVSFAIPIDVAMNVKDQLVATGHVRRGRIGVTIQEVNQTLADSFKLARPRGALVSDVEKGGPGADAGLKPGDVILAVDDKPIERSSELPPLIAGMKPGTQATLTVWRDRSERKLKVKIGELPEQQSIAMRDGGDASDTGKLGLAVRPLTGDEREQLRTSGRIVVEDADGPAALAGVERGDVIIMVNGAPVGSVAEFRKAVNAAGSTVALLIQRGDAQIFVPVRIDS
ncbi:MAG TPA: DegQ family serine endoprotease [Steroidobacteraceae bacterium]|jgi:serine protease Do|nr:DegQ family serine endoprotease [Steroidobacteraceae bacterium]